MGNRLVYSPVGIFFIILLAILLAFVVSLLFLDVLRTAFTRIGFTWEDAFVLLLVSLIGSGINIPLTTLESETPIVRDSYVRVFGVTYRIPVSETIHTDTVLAINFGGAIIPIMVSAYLLIQFPGAILYSAVGVIFVALIANRTARVVRGVGIVIPTLIPPLSAALAAMALVSIFSVGGNFVFIIAYIGGTMGSLLGADILNLGKIKDVGAPVASIGGAGTFDGVFLSGIIAVLLV